MVAMLFQDDYVVNLFKSHRGLWSTGLCEEYLCWSAPGTQLYIIEYTVCACAGGSKLVVGGGTGDMIYRWDCDMSLRDIAALDLDVFCSKCVAWGGTNYPRWGWSPDSCMRTLQSLVQPYSDKLAKTSLALSTPSTPLSMLPGYKENSCSTQENWEAWLSEFGLLVIGPTFYDFYSAGRVPSRWVELQWRALRLAGSVS